MGIETYPAQTRAFNPKLPARVFPPIATIRCKGPSVFRSQAARDLGCLLDLNPDIDSWTCMPESIGLGEQRHVPDFGVISSEGVQMYLDAHDRNGFVNHRSVAELAERRGIRYKLFWREEIYDGFRLRNAKDLLRYGQHHTPLGDRIRVLGALDEHGSLTLAECLQIFREANAMAGLASLILHRFVDVDLDEAVLGPETVVRRIGR